MRNILIRIPLCAVVVASPAFTLNSDETIRFSRSVIFTQGNVARQIARYRSKVVGMPLTLYGGRTFWKKNEGSTHGYFPYPLCGIRNGYRIRFSAGERVFRRQMVLPVRRLEGRGRGR